MRKLHALRSFCSLLSPKPSTQFSIMIGALLWPPRGFPIDYTVEFAIIDRQTTQTIHSKNIKFCYPAVPNFNILCKMDRSAPKRKIRIILKRQFSTDVLGEKMSHARKVLMASLDRISAPLFGYLGKLNTKIPCLRFRRWNKPFLSTVYPSLAIPPDGSNIEIIGTRFRSAAVTYIMGGIKIFITPPYVATHVQTTNSTRPNRSLYIRHA